ncbi:MAG: GNAT family N-acetyltransferase [Planctomycetota bacterium]
MGAAGIQIAVCDEATLRAALELVLAPLPPNQRGPLVDTLGRLRDEPLGAFDALVAATARGRVVAAAWGQPQPGKTAALWLPQTDGVPLELVAIPLIERVAACADAAGVELTQVLLESDDAAATAPLLAAGFRRLTKLHYLEWRPALDSQLEEGDEKPHVDQSPRRAPSNPPPDLTPASSIDRCSLEALVASTYLGTLDCPELDGLRSVGDVLDGYEQTGEYDPDLWFVLRQDDREVGVLLLNEHRGSGQIELTYMGVAPTARGRGIGRSAVEAAQAIALKRGAERLVLAVDNRNTPARNVYKQVGFRHWACRYVYLRPASDG